MYNLVKKTRKVWHDEDALKTERQKAYDTQLRAKGYTRRYPGVMAAIRRDQIATPQLIRPPRRKLPQKHPKGSMTQRSHDNLPKQETLWDQCATARDGVLSNRKILPQLAHVPVQSREAEADHRGWWRREFLGTKRVLCMTPKLECGKLKPLTDFMQKVNMDNRKRIRHSWNLKYLKKRVDMRYRARICRESVCMHS